LNVSLLDHRGQRLLGYPPRLEEAREVRAHPELGDGNSTRRPASPSPGRDSRCAGLDGRASVRQGCAGSDADSISISRPAAKAIMSRRMSLAGLEVFMTDLGRGPFEGRCGLVVGFDESVDMGLEFAERVERRSPERLASRIENQISTWMESGCTRRREMEMHVRMAF
jgi:hypothetical protein